MSKTIFVSPDFALPGTAVVAPGSVVLSVREDERTSYQVPLTREEAQAAAFSLLRATLTDLQRETLSNALESWWSQCHDYGYDDERTETEALQGSLGLPTPGGTP